MTQYQVEPDNERSVRLSQV